MALGILTPSPEMPGMSRESTISSRSYDQLSGTSQAFECFVDQRFSQKLQTFMLGYVSSIYSNYSVYD